MIKQQPLLAGLLSGILVVLVAYLLSFRPIQQHYMKRIAVLEQQLQLYADSLTACAGSKQPVDSGALLFSDTFDDNLNKWDTRLQENGMKIIYDGKYIISYNEKGYFWWSWMTINKEAMNFKVTLKARQKSGSPDKPFGLMLSIDTANYYRFGITPNGYVSVNSKKGGKWQPNLVSYTGGFKTNAAEGWNTLEVEVRGIRVTFVANGKKVKDATLDFAEIWKRIGVFVEDVQTAEFDEVHVTELTD